MAAPLPASCLNPRSREPPISARERSKFASGRFCNGSPYKAPQCAACELHAPDAPRLFVRSRSDGLGERSLSVLFAMATAASYGLNFGGVVQAGCRMPHGVNATEAMSSLFGLTADNSFFMSHPPLTCLNFASGSEFLAKAAELKNQKNANICFTRANLERYKPAVTEEFLEAFRQGARSMNRPLKYFRPNVLNVAVHVRRGDLDPRNHGLGKRWIPAAWYNAFVAKMREAYEDTAVDVHVFSGTDRLKKATDLDDYEGFRTRGMQVHLDGDVLDDWSHMAHADILVMARSAFSLIPGIFNKQCILDPAIPSPDYAHFDGSWLERFNFTKVNTSEPYLSSPEFLSALRRCKELARK